MCNFGDPVVPKASARDIATTSMQATYSGIWANKRNSIFRYYIYCIIEREREPFQWGIDVLLLYVIESFERTLRKNKSIQAATDVLWGVNVKTENAVCASLYEKRFDNRLTEENLTVFARTSEIQFFVKKTQTQEWERKQEKLLVTQPKNVRKYHLEKSHNSSV